MTDTPRWFTTQLRVRQETHDYLVREARKLGLTITQVSGVILDSACSQGWSVGPVTVTRQPSAIVTREDGAGT